MARPHSIPDDKLEELRHKYVEGKKTLRALAAEYRCGTTAVRNALRRSGLERLTPSSPQPRTIDKASSVKPTGLVVRCQRCKRPIGEGDDYEERTVSIFDNIGHTEIQRRCQPLCPRPKEDPRVQYPQPSGSESSDRDNNDDNTGGNDDD